MRYALSRVGLTSVIVLIGSLCAAPVIRADGMLDPSFGKGGLVTTAFPGSFSGDAALSLMVMPDGRAVAAGSTDVNLAWTFMAVARYLVSGALDTTFDGDGLATVPFPAGGTGDTYAAAEAVLLQPDGRLVLVGGAANSYCNYFALARLNADGSPDFSFGSGGLVMTPKPGFGAKAGLLQPDGRIVAAGSTFTSIVVRRYNTDGGLDPTFGGSGTVVVPGSFIEVGGAALQPDGKVVIAGTSQTGGFVTRDFALVRLLPNGALDPSFGGDGIVLSDFGSIETGDSVIVLGDGRLVLAGHTVLDFAVARYLPDGSVDTTFGTAGLALVDSGAPEYPAQIVELPNANLLVAGTTSQGGGGAPVDFLLARLLPNGALDTSFGTGGFLSTDFNTGSDECNAIAIAGPDLVLTAGSTPSRSQPFVDDFGLARYIATIPVGLLTFEVE